MALAIFAARSAGWHFTSPYTLRMPDPYGAQSLLLLSGAALRTMYAQAFLPQAADAMLAQEKN